MARPKFTISPVETARPVVGIDKEVLTKSVDDGVYPLAMAKEIRLDRIQPDPNQPRHSFDEERLQELAASIREQGVLQPIVVEYIDEGNFFRLVHGERRWRASTLAGLLTIPAIIHKIDDDTRLVRQLIENIQREDLNDVDRAVALAQLKMNLGSPSWDVIAEKVGISKRRVLQLVDITRLPAEIQESIRDGELTEKHGRAAKMLPEERRLEFAETVRARQLSGDESLEVAKAIKTEPALPIEAAIDQVKERQAQDRQARKARTRQSLSGREGSETRPSPSTIDADGNDDSGPEIVRYLIEQPGAGHLVETRQAASLPADAPPDPLFALRAVPTILAALDPAKASAAANASELLALLEDIIDAALDLLAKIKP